jgi:hypothetical protein
MDKLHKETLQVTKEIIVKFIENGRVSPANFEEIFPSVYSVVRATLVDALLPPGEAQKRLREAEKHFAAEEDAG